MNKKFSSGIVRLQRIRNEKLDDARNLRQSMTKEESLLWERLRNRKLSGLKFRRQQIIEGFITDFYCETAKLAVEIDGGIHDEAEKKKVDIHREKVFHARGIDTLRIKNFEVTIEIEATLQKIKFNCENRLKL
jgi:very-short-patch-repair endonuclease